LTRLPTRADVLDLFGSDPRPIHLREIASRLRISEVDYLGLQRLLDNLSLEGVLTARPGQSFRLSSPTTRASGAEREGLLSVHPRGFGFVASLEANMTGDDVFVPPEAMGGAMHGDRVRVRIRSRGPRGAEGEVVRIVERGYKRAAGTLRRKGKSAWVEPDDARVRGPIVLTRTVDAGGPEGNSGADGDAVIVAFTRWPELPDENPEGRIEVVLGRPGELAVEAAKILVLERIQEAHSEDAVAEAEAFGTQIPDAARAGRKDLRSLPLPTIDPEDARDHDDAVWVERTEAGGYRAWIAIADVSAYVTPGTALDAEARARGCSIYLPDRAIPMLPRALSSSLCSLLPDVDRLCLCVEVGLDAGGHVTSSHIVRGVMRSRAKLTYGGVARALGLSADAPREAAAEELVDGLRVAYELSRHLRANRMKRGALDFELPEAKVVLHEQTREPVDVMRRAQDPGVKRAYQLIEELMLLANETVAHWCDQRGVATIYRVHAAPDEQKLERFAAMCDSLGIHFDIEDTRDPKKLGQLLKSFAEHPLAPVLNSLLLRSMKQATYEVTNVGHFGLASKAYLHFTSPIRRYPDLVVHRVVHAILSNKEPAGEVAKERLAETAFASSVAERRAMEVERAIVDLYRTFLMRDRVGHNFQGTVTAVVGSGVFLQLDAPFVDVLVRLEDLGHDRWEIDDNTLRAVALRSGDVVALGDRMTVEVIDISILRRTVYGRRIVGKDDATRPREKGTRKPTHPTESQRQRPGAKRPTTPPAAGRNANKASDRNPNSRNPNSRNPNGAAPGKKKAPRAGKPSRKGRRG
jgi:ribonuclease R